MRLDELEDQLCMSANMRAVPTIGVDFKAYAKNESAYRFSNLGLPLPRSAAMSSQSSITRERMAPQPLEEEMKESMILEDREEDYDEGLGEAAEDLNGGGGRGRRQ
eukprot:CAMPEP_0202978552 /NCGR_PEP_ID=MMETSP1396-20130829/84930_1 /ASSEMBLY_ACC=CAM_ASM_000872 /TAXON_ID= /ORGANISM="Pseudokeronopsis sp., Strain Brazil" /LENGTH=105 /DNA_ID=CAMNT_0049717547 /DNA_START=895 /DNA_END=1212 /DNA_ORIENTATION=-